MAMDDSDKWASQFLDDLLEKLVKVERIITPHTVKVKNKCQNISNTISNVITKDVSSQEPKSSGNHSRDSPTEHIEESGFFSQPCENKEVKYEISDESFMEKMLFQGEDCSDELKNSKTRDKKPRENSESSSELSISPHEISETIKKSSNTDSDSGKKHLPDSVLDSAIPLYDSWKIKYKDLSANNSEVFLWKDLQTDNADRECFQLNNDNPTSSIDELNYGFLTNKFESEERLLQNPERIEEKPRGIGYSERHDHNKNGNGQHDSIDESHYEHIDEKFTKQDIEYLRYTDVGKRSKSCSGVKIGNMSTIQGTEEYEKTRNVKTTINSLGNCCNIEIKHEELNIKENVINEREEDVGDEMILLERNIREGIEESEEKYEDICSNSKNDIEEYFDFKKLKKVINLMPLIESVALCSLDSDFTTDIESNTYPKRNHCQHLISNDVSSRISHQKYSKICQDVDDDPVTTQRYFKAISAYRNACRAFEDFVLSPSAMLIAESIDIIIFVFFLFVSIFYTFYVSINVKFNSFWNNRTNFNDLIKRKNCKEGNISDAYNFSRCSLKNKIERNHEFEQKDSSSFSSHAEETESSESKIEIYVVPEKIKVLKNVCEHAKQTLEDLFEKGSDFLENLCNEKVTAVVKSHEDILVDIFLKDSRIQSSERDQMKAKNASDFLTDSYLESIKSSDVKGPLYQNNSWKFIPFSNDTTDISEDTERKYPIEAEHNQSHLMEIPIFDKNRENIFNSTEIGNSIFESNTPCKTLSPSEINIFDSLCCSDICPGCTWSKCLQSSSLSVNANSYPTVSSSIFRYSSLNSFNQENTNQLLRDESFHTDQIGMRQDSEIVRKSNEMITDSLKNQTQSDELIFYAEPKSFSKCVCSTEPGEPHVEDTDESYNLFTLKSFPVNPAILTSNCSDVSDQISTIDTEEEQASYAHGKNAKICDCPESLSFSVSTEDIYDEICFTDSYDVAASDTRVLKKKSRRKLRHRMSGIFNNLKGVNFMQCVMSSGNRQKKYKKQTNGSDA